MITCNSLVNILSHFLTGVKEIQECTKESLKRRLQNSLSHDWIAESRAHAFPLKGYYVQLNWSRKIRKAMGTETVTLTSLHELIKEKMKANNAANHKKKSGQSVTVEGE